MTRFRQLIYLITLGVAAVTAAACASESGRVEADTTSSDDPWIGECDPGDRAECACDDAPGVTLCRANGQWGACNCTIDVPEDTDTGETDSESETDTGEEPFIPPPVTCPDGTVELNIRDIWSGAASPTLNEFDTLPNTVMIHPATYTGQYYGAVLDPENCEWYTACLPVGIDSIVLQATDPVDECPEEDNRSAPIDISAYTDGSRPKLWMTYEGTELDYDYTQAGWQGDNPVGADRFAIVSDMEEPPYVYDPDAAPTACTDTSDFKVVHIRWPWSDATVTGLSGTACEDEQAGIHTPAYPPVLRVTHGDVCAETLAVLERQDQLCPWYRLLIPKSSWGGEIKIEYPDQQAMLFTANIPLPATTEDELWLVYEGAPDDASNPSGGNCMNWSQRSNVYHFYTSNLGPYYPTCGGAPVPETHCGDIKPIGHSIVHFRYIWAGQKTFTYFPNPDLMPRWMVMEVNGGGGNKDVICWREADSPWFRCPVPDDEFYPEAEWRAVDKTRNPEWNTVAPRGNFPAEPGTYWLRWTYGKPDIPDTSEFEFTDYYPDGVAWAATGSWGADFCFSEESTDRPPIASDGFFPWNETRFAYANGQSIAEWYSEPDKVQGLLNYLVYERYLKWKSKYIVYDNCGPGTARVNRPDYNNDTVSEGQGYGMAIAAAVGDKELFGKLFKFVKYYLSQYEGKYCGGLMGWKWDSEENCRPFDKACNIEEGACDGNGDSAFDGDVDIAVGLLYAAWQWPEYTEDAVEWILRMECEVNTAYDGTWYYPVPGDTFDKVCTGYPDEPCFFGAGQDGRVNMSYYPPGYFRAFGEFLQSALNPVEFTPAERRNHRDFWYRTADTVWEMTERCYGQSDVHPALLNDWGTYAAPCSAAQDNYNWSRGLWRLAIDAAWYGDDTSLLPAAPGSSYAYAGKSQMQAKMDLIQEFYAHVFPRNNPPAESANRFSTICRDLSPDGTVEGCDPAYDHNSYFVNTAMCAFATFFDNDGKTTDAIRREALEEAVSASIENDRYYQESIGVYTLLFLTGNFPKPFSKIDDSIPVV